MCLKCFDFTSEEVLEQTGIRKDTMNLIDDLTIAALEVGRQLAGDAATIDGDPLKEFKIKLAQYVSGLEQELERAGKEPNNFIPVMVMPLMKLPDIMS